MLSFNFVGNNLVAMREGMAVFHVWIRVKTQEALRIAPCFCIACVLNKRIGQLSALQPTLPSLFALKTRVSTACSYQQAIIRAYVLLENNQCNLRPLNAEIRVCAQVSPCGICGRQDGNETIFSPSSSAFPFLYHLTFVPHSYICEINNRLIGGRSSGT
jgi:hypothetical protein